MMECRNSMTGALSVDHASEVQKRIDLASILSAPREQVAFVFEGMGAITGELGIFFGSAELAVGDIFTFPKTLPSYSGAEAKVLWVGSAGNNR